MQTFGPIQPTCELPLEPGIVARKVSGKVEDEVLQPRDGEGGQKQLTLQGS